MLYDLLLQRVESDIFLKSKNSLEYKKLRKEIEQFKPKKTTTFKEKVNELIRFEKSLIYFRRLMKKFVSAEYLKYSSYSNESSDFLLIELENAFKVYEMSFEVPLNKNEIQKNFKDFLRLTGDNTFMSKYILEDHPLLQKKRENLISIKPEKNPLIFGNLRPEPPRKERFYPSAASYNTEFILNPKYMKEAGINEISGISEKYIELTSTVNINKETLKDYVLPVNGNYKCNDKKYSFSSFIEAKGIAEGFNENFNKVVYSHVNPKFFIDKTGIYILAETRKKMDLLLAFITNKKNLKKKDLENFILDQYKDYEHTFIYPELLLTINREIEAILNGYKNPIFMAVYFTGDNIYTILQDKLTLFRRT